MTKSANDPDGSIAAAIQRMGNSLQVVETAVGTGFRTMRARDPSFRSKNLGEQAVAEHVLRLLDQKAPGFVPLVWFEDPGVVEMEMFKNERIHFLTTAALLQILLRSGLLPDAKSIQRQIDGQRKSPLAKVERPGRIMKRVSQWRPKAKS